MTARRSLLAAAALVAAAALAPAASAAPDRAAVISLEAPAFAWNGIRASGLNMSFYEGATTGLANCGKDLQNYCDETLIKLDHPKPTGASLNFRLDGFDPQPSDFDLRVYRSDASGRAIEYLGDPTGDGTGVVPPLTTFHGDYETKVVTGLKANAYYLVQVVYFNVVNGTYKAKVTASKLPAVAPAPAARQARRARR